MTNLRDAIDYYHSLLDGQTALESQAQLNDQLHRRELFFGERPLCTVLRPRFLTPEQYRFLQTAIRAAMPAFAKVYRAALADPAFRAQCKLTEWEEQLIVVEPGFRDPSPTSRMDSFFVPHPPLLSVAQERGGGPGVGGEGNFTEYNA